MRYRVSHSRIGREGPVSDQNNKIFGTGNGWISITGLAQVCVQGEPCISAIHAYYQAFVQQGCAERLQLESTSGAAVPVISAAALDQEHS